jgi:hypothetical protein
MLTAQATAPARQARQPLGLKNVVFRQFIGTMRLPGDCQIIEPA